MVSGEGASHRSIFHPCASRVQYTQCCTVLMVASVQLANHAPAAVSAVMQGR